jgi:hypothetical protein
VPKSLGPHTFIATKADIGFLVLISILPPNYSALYPSIAMDVVYVRYLKSTIQIHSDFT